MEIRFYTQESIAKLYLSTYAEVSRQKDSISFRSTLFMNPITIPVQEEQQSDLLRSMDAGLTMEECVCKLAECLHPSEEDWLPEKEKVRTAKWILQQLMVRGILE